MQGNLPFLFGLGAMLLATAGCQPAPPEAPGIQVDLQLEPSPPSVGTSAIAVKLTDARGMPLERADVRLEGNMNHAGMKPVFADLQEVEPGSYTGSLEFTMGGDWFILVTARLPDGKRLERKIDVPGVKSP